MWLRPSLTIFIFVKITLVKAGFVTKKGSAAELFRTFQGVIVPENPQCSAVGEAEVNCNCNIQSRFHSPIEWACYRVTDSHPPTNEPCRQTLLLAGAPGCPTGSTTGLLQCDSLQRSLVHGSGRLPYCPSRNNSKTTSQGQGKATQPKNETPEAKRQTN